MEVDVYVDGSYLKTTPKVTRGGVVILLNGKPLLGQRLKTSIPSLVKMQSAGGEVLAAMSGIQVAVNTLNKLVSVIDGKKIVNVYYDYRGINDWLDDAIPYRARQSGSQIYVQRVSEIMKENPDVKVVFHKIKAHTGVKWNEVADSLANWLVPRELNGVKVVDIG